MNKTNDCLMIGSYVCGLNSELFLHTDKNHWVYAVINAEKHLHFEFVSVHVCSNLFLHRLGMSSLGLKQMETIFLVHEF